MIDQTAIDRSAKAEALLLHFTAEAHRRKWNYDRGLDDDGVPIKSEAFDALHRLGEEMRVKLEELRATAAAFPAVPAPDTNGVTPSRRAGLRDEIVNALGRIKTVPPVGHRREQADHVLAVLYREWPQMRAEAEDAAVLPAPDQLAAVTPPPAFTEEGRLRSRLNVLEDALKRSEGLSKVGARCMREGHQGLIEHGRVTIEGHRFALSVKLDLGTGASWDAIHERVAELRRLAGDTQHNECPTPLTHNWGCGCPTDQAPAREARQDPAPGGATALPDGHPIPWDQLAPYEQQQGGYWLYPPGCDVHGKGRVWVAVTRSRQPDTNQET